MQAIYEKALVYYYNKVDPEKFTAAGNGLCIVISKFTKKPCLSYNELIKQFPELKTANKQFLGWRDRQGYEARVNLLIKAIKKLDPKWVNMY